MADAASRRRVWVALLAIFVLACATRFAFWAELRGTALDQWHRYDQSDMATYVEQARRIKEADPLQPDPYHPYHSWQSVAPPQKWLEWYGPHSFHQAPAYSYLLALALHSAGDAFAPVKAAQLLLGAGTCVLLFLIARHLWGFAAGVAAGFLAAIYGPLLFLEAQLLREGPALFCILALTLALMRHVEREHPSARRMALACAGLGLGGGAFAMLHEMGSVLTLVLLISLGVRHFRSGARSAILAVACTLAGWLAGFSPLLARNLAVGAPPLSVSCRTVINFVESNVADAPDGGATFAMPGPTVVKVLDESHGSGLAALAGVWRTYDGDFGAALSNLGKKLAANWLPWEVPDNTSFEFFREHAATLRFTPTFAVLFPLGFAGMVIAVWSLRRRRERAPDLTKKELKRMRRQAEQVPSPGEPDASPEERPSRLASHLVLILLLLGLTASLSLVHTVARFRMYLVPFCIVYAGILCAVLWDALREKRGGKVVALAAWVALGCFLQQAIPSSAFVQGMRAIDYAVACKLSIDDGDVDAARRYAAGALANFPRDGMVYGLAGSELEKKGDREAAIEFYRRALEVDPTTQIARDGLRRLKAQ